MLIYINIFNIFNINNIYIININKYIYIIY